MTVDDLVKLMVGEACEFYSLPAELPVELLYEAQARSIVRALRGEIWARVGCVEASDIINEILGDAEEKVADTVAQVVEPLEVREVTGASPVRTATAPAPAVCEWTHKESWIGEGVAGEAGCDGARRFRRRKRNCPSCGKPIRFSEAK